MHVNDGFPTYPPPTRIEQSLEEKSAAAKTITKAQSEFNTRFYLGSDTELWYEGFLGSFAIKKTADSIIAALDTEDIVKGFLPYLRDGSIPLPSGKTYCPDVGIPSKDNLLFELHTQALLPKEMRHMICGSSPDPEGVSGQGFSEIGFKQTKKLAAKFQWKLQQTHSLIEGGNTINYINKNKEHKVILGYTTLAFTTIHLRNKGFFKDITFDPDISPDPSIVEAARKIGAVTILSKKCLENQLFDATAKIFCSIQENKLDQQTTNFFAVEANILKQQLDHTKKIIAHDLETEPDNIAWVYNQSYHIDLDMLLRADQEEILLNDPYLVDKLLRDVEKKALHQKDQNTAHFVAKCITHVSNRKKIFDKTIDHTTRALTQIGLKIRLMPLEFSDGEETLFTLANGIFLKKPGEPKYFFLASQISKKEEKLVQETFVNYFEKTLGNVEYLPTVNSTFSFTNEAGIRCLTHPESVHTFH